jgi:hypothetical protein
MFMGKYFSRHKNVGKGNLKKHDEIPLYKTSLL